MKVGVVSDSHVSKIDQLPSKLVDGLKEVDLIVHLGDYTGKELLDSLRGLGDFRGVFGNMDPLALRSELPEKEVIEANGKRLGLIHGWGAPWGIHKKIKDRFKGVDAVLYGHTHIASIKETNGILMINPGSLTRPMVEQGMHRFIEEIKPRPSIAILTINDGLISAIIKKL